MTIGDEKVVAETGPVYMLLWAGTDSVASIVNAHGLRVGDKLIPQSAYAELAAERDEMATKGRQLAELAESLAARMQAAESQLAEERELRMSLESSWQQAEAQLAELRGKLEERCMVLDGLAGVIRQYGLCAPMALEEVAKQIRALAVADGG